MGIQGTINAILNIVHDTVAYKPQELVYIAMKYCLMYIVFAVGIPMGAGRGEGASLELISK